jgi:hypothetical protein
MGNKKRVIQLNLTSVPFTTEGERVAIAAKIERILNQHIEEFTNDFSCRDFPTAVGSILKFQNSFSVTDDTNEYR